MELSGQQVGGLVREILAQSPPIAWLPINYVVQVEEATCRQLGFEPGPAQFDPVISLKTGIAYIRWLYADLERHGVDRRPQLPTGLRSL